MRNIALKLRYDGTAYHGWQVQKTEASVAMECRCYHGGEGRTRLRQLKYAGKDWAVLVFFLVIAVLVGVLGHFGL